MPIINFIDHSGNAHAAAAEAGMNLMEIAVEHDIDGILGECGGHCVCATCHCYIDESWAESVPARSSIEENMLECAADPVHANSRLSCQITVNDALDGLVVRLPEHQV